MALSGMMDGYQKFGDLTIDIAETWKTLERFGRPLVNSWMEITHPNISDEAF